MKILFVDQYAQLGGAQQCLLDVLAAVSASGRRAALCLPEPGPLADAAASAGAEVLIEPFGSYSPTRKRLPEAPRYVSDSVRLANALGSRIEIDRPDLLYVNGPRPLPAASWAARRKQIPLIFHCHSCVSQPVAIRLMNLALRINTAHVISCCRFAVEPIKRSVGRKQAHLVYNGVRGPGELVRPTRPAGEWRIGVVGRIAPEKGQAEFLEAARIVTQHIPTCRFVIAGEPLFASPTVERYAREVRRRAQGLPVEFLGWREDVYPVIVDLDLLVVPSINEPATTRVILEAFACGVPVVAFASGGIGEILADKETGVLVTELAANALATAIVDLLKSGNVELRRLGSNGREEWLRRYTVERFQQEVLAVIDQAASAQLAAVK